MEFSSLIKQNAHDVSSLSNFDKVRQTDYEVDLFINFEKQILEGTVIISFDIIDSNEKTIVIDTKKLHIETVSCLETNKELSFKIHKDHKSKDSLGTPLEILLPTDLNGNKIRVKISYTTTLGNDGILWLANEQTLTKNKPFMFTQGEAILGRTIYPCQDSPSAKVTFSKVRLVSEEGISSIFGGAFISKNEIEFRNKKCVEYFYCQKVCIPTYLFAIAAGELEFKKISERCGIFAEIPLLNAAVEEFADTEVYLKAAEEYFDYPYIWGEYNIVILPQAFPFGGMENPNLTFINPSLIVGDKSMLPTIAHEIIHSWMGNLVTNKDWNNFWMNEGFTVFMERKLCQIVLGKEHAILEAEVGYNELLYAIKACGENHNYSQLYMDFKDEDPDDAFSVVPYEKGFNLLYYLETLIGEVDFRNILRKYIKTYAYKSIEFKHYKEVFETELKELGKESLLKQIDWESWVYKPGYLIVEVNFKTQLSENAKDLFKLILNGEKSVEKINEIYSSFDANTKLVFLNEILNNVSKVDQSSFELIKKATSINQNLKHPEIAYTWFQIAFALKDKDSIEYGKQYLLKQGRMKYVRPVLRELYKFDKEECLKFFNANKWIYHAVPVRIIENDFIRIYESQKK